MWYAETRKSYFRLVLRIEGLFQTWHSYIGMTNVCDMSVLIKQFTLHNVAFIKYWRNNGDSRSLPFFLPSPSPLSFFRPRTYCKGYYFYSPQSSIVIKSKMAATTILRTRTRFRAPKIRLHCRLVCNGLGGNVWYFPLFFNAESNEETMRVCTCNRKNSMRA